MQTVICHSNYDIWNRDGNMFSGGAGVSVKDFLTQMLELKKRGLGAELDFKTSDQVEIHEADAFLFVDMPTANEVYYNSAIKTGKPLFLLAWESGIINPRNSMPELHERLSAVFTYDDSLIDNTKYIKVGYSFLFPNALVRQSVKDKLCCMIAANKVSDRPLELYSSRLQVAKWFEENHPDDFDLYGQFWRKNIPSRNIIDRALNKIPIINNPFATRRPSYRGEVKNKLDTYSNYSFAICYENARDLQGYISEKIFDCFFAKCVPIYWGAPNITDYIPSECFIDRRGFSDNADIYRYISTMTDVRYKRYLDSIEKFLDSSKAGVFSVDYFARTIIHNMRKKL